MAPLLALAVLLAYCASWDRTVAATESTDEPKMSDAVAKATVLVPVTGVFVDTTIDVFS